MQTFQTPIPTIALLGPFVVHYSLVYTLLESLHMEIYCISIHPYVINTLIFTVSDVTYLAYKPSNLLD